MKKDYRELYEKITKSDWFKKAYHNKSLGECPIIVKELEESEDERIRKFLMDYFKCIKSTLDDGMWKGFQIEDILEYLEKQKDIKVKYVYPKFRIGDIISNNKPEPGLINDYTIVGFNNELPDYLVDGGNVPSCSIGIEFIDSNYHLKEQKPVEWSEEDEKMLASFLHKVEVCNLLSNKENVWIVKRLKSLRPQTKQEWNEGDKKTINEILSFFRKMAFGETTVTDTDEAARWHDWLVDKIYPTVDGKGDTTGHCLDGDGECDDAVTNGRDIDDALSKTE